MTCSARFLLLCLLTSALAVWMAPPATIGQETPPPTPTPGCCRCASDCQPWSNGCPEGCTPVPNGICVEVP